MGDTKTEIGRVGWLDLTVPDAAPVREFYQKVVGWTSSGFDMGGYEDFCMNLPGSGETVAGICNAKGGNASQPTGWIVYITVADLDESLRQCAAAGGKLLSGPREYAGQGRFAVIQDPAGASVALYQYL
jgi:predicted enzyme related to lactoylglutathione lyase